MTDCVTAMPEGPKGMTFPLTNIKLHSPSTIVGTPLDPSARFEYPFPSPKLEYESKNPSFHPRHSNYFPVGPPSCAKQRQSHVHPNHDVVEVPVPPTLDKRVNIELRFPRPMEGGKVLGQAQASIKRRADTDDTSKKS